MALVRKARPLTLAEEFRAFRMNFLYSQRDLAQKIACSRRTVQSVESGRITNPHPATLRRFREFRRRSEAEALAASRRSKALEGERPGWARSWAGWGGWRAGRL